MDNKMNNKNEEKLPLDNYNIKETSTMFVIPFWVYVILTIVCIFSLFLLLSSGILDFNNEFIDILCCLGLISPIFIMVVLILINSNNSKNKNVLLLEEKTETFMIVDSLNNEEKEVYIPEIITISEVKKTITKQKEVKPDLLFKTAGLKFNDFFKVKGYETRFGGEFISSMLYSRLLVFKGNGDINVISQISSAFNLGAIIIDLPSYKERSIIQEGEFNQLLKIATLNINRPCFLFVNNISADEFTFFDDILSYIDTPNEQIAFGEIALPKNLYFVVNLKTNESTFNIDRKYLKLAYITKFDYTETGAINRNCETVPFSLIDIERFLKKPDQTNLLKEEIWKKFDGFIEIIESLNSDYSVNNKAIVRLENFFVSYLEVEEEKTQIQAFDLALSSTILNDALKEGTPNDFVKDLDLFNYFNNQFGENELILTEALIKEYYALFDSEGNRHYE